MHLNHARAFLAARVDELAKRSALSPEESVELAALRAVLQATAPKPAAHAKPAPSAPLAHLHLVMP